MFCINVMQTLLITLWLVLLWLNSSQLYAQSTQTAQTGNESVIIGGPGDVDEWGSIASPGFPHSYPPTGNTYQWKLVNRDHMGRIQILFDDYDLADNATITLYGASGNLVNMISSVMSARLTYMFYNDQNATIVFYSGSWSAYKYGFKLTYRFTGESSWHDRPRTIFDKSYITSKWNSYVLTHLETNIDAIIVLYLPEDIAGVRLKLSEDSSIEGVESGWQRGNFMEIRQGNTSVSPLVPGMDFQHPEDVKLLNITLSPRYSPFHIRIRGKFNVGDSLLIEISPVAVKNGSNSSTFNQFYCKSSGLFIPYRLWCNGLKDCEDNTDEQSCSDFEMRLRYKGNLHNSEGLVEIKLPGAQWGSVCGTNWDNGDARVVCRMLGYKNQEGKAFNGTQIGSSLPFWLSEAHCWGFEGSLTTCPHSGWGNGSSFCGPGNYASVDCRDADNCNGFYCGFGECVSYSRQCDGQIDCSGGQDEQNCFCNGFKCRSVPFQCLSSSQVCDGHYDCSEGEEEGFCPSPSEICQSDEFNCKNGPCLAGYKKCNGLNDCFGGEDEENCSSDNSSIWTWLAPLIVVILLVPVTGVCYARHVKKQEGTNTQRTQQHRLNSRIVNSDTVPPVSLLRARSISTTVVSYEDMMAPPAYSEAVLYNAGSGIVNLGIVDEPPKYPVPDLPPPPVYSTVSHILPDTPVPSNVTLDTLETELASNAADRTVAENDASPHNQETLV